MKNARQRRRTRDPRECVGAVAELADLLAVAIMRMRSVSTLATQNSPSSRLERVSQTPLSVPPTARLTAVDEETLA